MLEDLSKVRELQKMKVVATALLVVAFMIFVIASFFEAQFAWIGFVRATAEAAMVGAVADWFAVTALFRHPLGLKIPHTAIIPNRKHDISQKFARFVRDNFLTEEVITDKLQSTQATRQVAHWLSQPANSELIADQVAVSLTALVKIINDEDVQILMENRVVALLRSTPFSPFIGNILSLLMTKEYQRELLLEMLKRGSAVLKSNRDTIIAKIDEELPWWGIALGADKRIYQAIADTVDSTLREIRAKPDHPLYQNYQATIDKFIADLKSSPEVLEKERTIKEEILGHSVVREFSSTLWADLKTSFTERSENPDLEVRRVIQQVLVSLGEAILNDPALYAKVDRWLAEIVVYLTHTYGHEVEHLISNTIDRWDADIITHKIETEVGRDLQFIRINGTVIGGLVGLLIYTLSFLVQLWLV